MTFQTRATDGEIRFFKTFAEAKIHAEMNPNVWKISFTIAETGERIRLVREHNRFTYQNIDGTY